MEAFISLLVVLSAISFVSWEISLNNFNVYAARSRLAQSMAAYDAAEQIAANRSTNGCVALARSTGDASCLGAVMESYREAFGLRHFELAFPGLSIGNATGNGTSECVPIRFTSLNETSEVCIFAGS